MDSAAHDGMNTVGAPQTGSPFDRAVLNGNRRECDMELGDALMFNRYTWHQNGAVYGAPRKQLDGATHVQNLFVCGTDQGFVGIVGAIVSGISIANQHCLRDV